MTNVSNPWRVLLWAKGVLALVVVFSLCFGFNWFQFGSAFAHWPPDGQPTLASRFSTWDVAHYLRLSQDGYQAGNHSCAFYPLWPGMIHAAAALTVGRPLLASLVLTTVLSVIGLGLFYRLVERHYPPEVARDSLILMLAFPGALFFSFPYTEALYLVLLMVFFWGLELERWSWTAVAGLLLPLARPVGIFMIAPLTWYFFERTDWARGFLRAKGREGGTATSTNAAGSDAQPPGPARLAAGRTGSARWLVPVMLLLCPLLGYAAYFGVMYAWTGNPFEGFVAQKAYPNSPSIANMFDFPAFWSAFTNVGSLDGMMDSALDRGFFVLFLALLPLIYRLNKTWFWYTLPTGLVPALTSYFMSYRRYIMVCFPVFIVLAMLLGKTKSRWVFWYYVVILAVLQGWAVKQFVNFNWAG
ncbi:MAG TPA: hypothetical protein VN887_18290 [Candidatus Angelobacter sp.]|nr:hypothetical protein [Candidatus Angelobacter sp.]